MSAEPVLFYADIWIPLAEQEPGRWEQWCAVCHWHDRDRLWHPAIEVWTDTFVLAPGVWMFPFCECDSEYTYWCPLPAWPWSP